MAGRASLVDVARYLGVAPSTVSRAFNHPQRLLPDTVQRVKDAAEELGYIPNRHAQALTTGRTGAIGLVLPDIINPFFPKLVRAAQRAVQDHDLSMFVAETHSDPAQERRQIATMTPQTEGLVIASSRLTADEIRHVAQNGRVVLVNTDTDGVDRVLTSSARALRQGLEHLAACGTQRVCYVGGPRRSWAQSERRGTVERVCAELGMQASFLHGDSGTYAEARELAAGVAATGADAVVAFDDIIAHGVLDGLLLLGIRVPSDVSLLGCDDALPIQTHPRLSTISLRISEAISRAVQVLLDRDDRPAPQRIVVEGDLVLRQTTPPLPG